MCKDEIFKEIGGRNHLNFVNNEILMFLMIKDSQNTCQREVNNKIGSEAFRSCARTKFLRKLVVKSIKLCQQQNSDVPDDKRLSNYLLEPEPFKFFSP